MAGVQGMDMENLEQKRHPFVRMEDVRMEILDLGGENEDAELIQQT